LSSYFDVKCRAWDGVQVVKELHELPEHLYVAITAFDDEVHLAALSLRRH
jgi:hypothetical protein